MHVCRVMSSGPVSDAWDNVGSDVTTRQLWCWCGKFLRGMRSSRLAPRYHLPSEALVLASEQNSESGHISVNTAVSFSWVAHNEQHDQCD